MTAPFRRRGPRPLPLHLGLAGIRAMAAAGMLPGMPWPNASPPLSAAWPISKAGQAEAARISAALASAGHAPEAFRGAVLNRLLRADRALVAGLAAYRRNDLPGALRSFKQATRLEPTLAAAWHRRGEVAWNLGDAAEATTSLRKAIDLRPSAARSRELLSLVEPVESGKSGTGADSHVVQRPSTQ